MAFRLPRLPQFEPTWPQMQAWWQQVVEAVEGQEGVQDQLIADLAAAVAAVAAAQAAATAAQLAADAAAATADQTGREMGRINSYTVPTNVLTAADAGTDVTITIAAHTRVYPLQGTTDVPDVAVAGGTITGLAFSTTYYVYYDDVTLADTTPAYVATTTPATAQVGAGAGRHFVGVVTTPADGGAGTGGDGGYPPGGGGGYPLP